MRSGMAIAVVQSSLTTLPPMNTTPRYPPDSNDIEAQESSDIFCVLCSARTRRNAGGGLRCAIGGEVPPRLAQAMAEAVARVAAPHTPTHEPRLASFVACPNCTTELQRYAADQPAACVICGLQLDVPDAAEIADFRARHRDPVTDP